MNLIRLAAAMATLVFGAVVFATPASAQATRTWVSGVGDDANPCSRTAPCKTFAGAISKTSASGEIDCLDPGGFGALTITKAITIDCENSGNGGVLVSGTNGFVIDVASTDHVQLIGLDFDGLGPGFPSLNGVKIIGSGNVAIINCLIYGFQNTNGLDGNGVLFAGTAGANVMIVRSTIRDNTNGVAVEPQNGFVTGVTIDNSNVDSNLVANVVSNLGGVVILNSSSLLVTPTAIQLGGGSVISFGNNAIGGAGAPTMTQPLR